MNRKTNRWRGALGAALVVGLLAGCDFISPIETNPNAIPSATMDQILTAVEANSFAFAEGQLGRLTAMWTQQMAGTDRQFVTLDSWVFTEEEGDDYYNAMYTGGGLVDIRTGIAQAEEAATARAQTLGGILKIHEAYFIGMGASIWGDLVYTQAVNPDEFPQPQLDNQTDVYAAVQALLTEAIGDLTAGGTHSMSSDLVFGGNATRWIEVANSLKARYYLHTGELANAITAAQAGIDAPANNWTTVHSASATEDNLWWEFTVEQRSGYISTGKYLVDLLQNNADPRLAIYFDQTDAGTYVGSVPATSGAGYSPLGTAIASQASEHAIISCAETQFILAEAQERTTAGSGAAALDAGIQCQEDRYGITIPYFTADPTGADLLEEIMTQKYVANFLNIEAWMDYRRTCLPDLRSTETASGGRVGHNYPSRLYYADDETQNNENIPGASTAGNRLVKADMENLSGFWSTYNSCLP